MTIPVGLLADLKCIPRDRPVALMMRHSVRYPILDPAETFLVGLTEEGVRLAEELGGILGQAHRCGRLLAAPVGRCLDTANAIARGAGWAAVAQAEERLSAPYIDPAWQQYYKGEVDGVLPAPVRGTLGLLVEHSPQAGFAPSLPRLDVMVTHDTILATVVGCLLKVPVLGEKHWPGYLEGLFAWQDGKQVYIRWRGRLWVFDEDFVAAGGVD